MIDKHLFVKNVTEQPSRHGGFIFRIDLVDLDTTKEYHTYADPNNFNYKHWEPIVRKQENGFIIKNCKIKNGKLNQVDADSKIDIVMDITGREAIEQINRHLDEQKAKYNMPKIQQDLFQW